MYIYNRKKLFWKESQSALEDKHNNNNGKVTALSKHILEKIYSRLPAKCYSSIKSKVRV